MKKLLLFIALLIAVNCHAEQRLKASQVVLDSTVVYVVVPAGSTLQEASEALDAAVNVLSGRVDSVTTAYLAADTVTSNAIVSKISLTNDQIKAYVTNNVEQIYAKRDAPAFLYRIENLSFTNAVQNVWTPITNHYTTIITNMWGAFNWDSSYIDATWLGDSWPGIWCFIGSAEFRSDGTGTNQLSIKIEKVGDNANSIFGSDIYYGDKNNIASGTVRVNATGIMEIGLNTTNHIMLSTIVNGTMHGYFTNVTFSGFYVHRLLDNISTYYNTNGLNWKY